MKESQVKKIHNHLLLGKKISAIEALNRFGCFRLSDVIFRLRNKGVNIKTEMVEINNKKVGIYFLIK